MPRLSPVREGDAAQEGPEGVGPEPAGSNPSHLEGSAGASPTSGGGTVDQAPSGAAAGAGPTSAAAEGPEEEA
eukprot:10354112-Alexandrium_andersonii.AAC.1